MALRFHPEALTGIPDKDAERLKARIDWLWANRLAVQHHPLRANLSGFYKRRVGDYRIIYTWDANPDDMVIRLVGTRDEIYDRPV